MLDLWSPEMIGLRAHIYSDGFLDYLRPTIDRMVSEKVTSRAGPFLNGTGVLYFERGTADSVDQWHFYFNGLDFALPTRQEESTFVEIREVSLALAKYTK